MTKIIICKTNIKRKEIIEKEETEVNKIERIYKRRNNVMKIIERKNKLTKSVLKICGSM